MTGLAYARRCGSVSTDVSVFREEEARRHGAIPWRPWAFSRG